MVLELFVDISSPLSILCIFCSLRHSQYAITHSTRYPSLPGGQTQHGMRRFPNTSAHDRQWELHLRPFDLVNVTLSTPPCAPYSCNILPLKSTCGGKCIVFFRARMSMFYGGTLSNTCRAMSSRKVAFSCFLNGTMLPETECKTSLRPSD